MIPYSYNMVDMGGIDLAEAHGTVVEGLYNRLALARNACGDLILYNWKFAEIEIAPGICATLDEGSSILINGLIQVTEQDEIFIAGIVPQPVIQPLSVEENGNYVPPSGVDGYAPVTVNVRGGAPDVPSGYTRLEYIESTGIQYIDTGVSDNSGMYCRIRACLVEPNIEWDAICAGQDVVGGVPANGLIMRYAASNTYGAFVGGSASGDLNTGLTISYNVMSEIIADTRNSRYYISTKGGNGSLSRTGSRGTRSLFLFASSNGGTPSFYSKAKIDYMKLYNSSGQLVRDFYASKRNSDNVAGLWDKVSESFFVNNGAGVFIAGPDAN